MKRVILFAIILISIQNSNQIEFTVEGLSPDSCSGTKQSFSIRGRCQESCSSITDRFMLDLETSKKDKIKAECFPIQTLGVYKLSCSIDISAYPLDNVNLILPTKPPKVDKYTFTNWESVIGANPGTSNVLTDIECMPTIHNTFNPSSISIEDCDIMSKHPFTISGEWEDKTKKNYLTDYDSATIILDNGKNDAVDCNYMSSPTRFECKFEGSGLVKIKEQIVTISSNSFKIKEFDSKQTVSECDDDDLGELLLSAMSLNLNKILIVICLLLF